MGDWVTTDRVTKVSRVIQRGIEAACKQEGSTNLEDCVGTIGREISQQFWKICMGRSAENRQKVNDLTCVDSLQRVFWRSSRLHLKPKLPRALKYLAEEMPAKAPMEAWDRTTHSSLVFFVGRLAELHVENERRYASIPPRARCMNYHEYKVFTKLNEDRARHGAPPVQPDCDLARTARNHSRDIALHKPLWEYKVKERDDPKYDPKDDPHIGSNGSDPHGRIMAAIRFRFMKSAENTWRSGTMYTPEMSEQAQRALMDSPGHRRNILDPEFTHVGVGIYVLEPHGKRRQQVFVTQNFAGVPSSKGRTASQNASGR